MTSPVFIKHFPSSSRSSSPFKPPGPGKNTLSHSHSRVCPSVEQVSRHLHFPEEDDQDLAILRLLPVSQKEGPRQISSPHDATEIDFLASHKAKKQKVIFSNSSSNIILTHHPLQLAKGLSKDQLVELLATLARTNPGVSSDIEKFLPKPDLSGLVSNLIYLNQNIYKAIPVTRLSGRTDSLAYHRVVTHLVAFKKCLVEDLNMLLEAGQWDSLVEFVVKSWDIVGATPLWDNPAHNTSRNSCFKHLAASVIRVLKQQGSLARDIQVKLVTLMSSSAVREAQLCREMLVKLNVN